MGRGFRPSKKLAKIRDEDGSKSLAGFGCARSNEEAYLFQKLLGLVSKIIT